MDGEINNFAKHFLVIDLIDLTSPDFSVTISIDWQQKNGGRLNEILKSP